ncbi:transcriptional regulator domain-containing protein [Novosphingobium sp.]|uniref:transcriptional regulator domain-containing protein n=1 Tax=Novosphingobium sp. TaxID=1874826 RepID=UPI00352B74C5
MATAPTTLAFEAVMRRGPSALAWEVLRRDPGYIAEYRQLAPTAEPGVAADQVFAARWGVHFR